MRQLKVLYVGEADGTCAQRARALESLGHRLVRVVSGEPRRLLRRTWNRATHRLGGPWDVLGTNRALAAQARVDNFDVVWVDKGLTVRPATLKTLRDGNRNLKMIHYSPDDMFNPSNQSRRYLASIPLYDLHVTTKSFNVSELETAGARDVLFVSNAYDPETHRPLELTAGDRARFGAEAGFIGTYEPERAQMMIRLAEAGIPTTIWGNGWQRLKSHPGALDVRLTPLPGLDYSRAINATRINLGFLRKVNRDLQTQRSIEIPACGGFLLAERTQEHLDLFEEGVEAEFFDGFDELLEKTRRYLADEPGRLAICRAGRDRCLRDGRDYASILARALERVLRGGARA